MALQASGAISSSQIQGEFGGTNPISLSEYYKDGANVPSTVTTQETIYSNWQYHFVNYRWYVWNSGTRYKIDWNGSQIGEWTASSPTTKTVGSFTYYRGTEQYYYIDEFNNWERRYELRRSYVQTTNTPVNSSVPVSGAISFDDFYGGRKV